MPITSSQRIHFEFLFDTLLNGIDEIRTSLALILFDLENGIFPPLQTEREYEPIKIIGPFPPSPIFDPWDVRYSPRPIFDDPWELKHD